MISLISLITLACTTTTKETFDIKFYNTYRTRGVSYCGLAIYIKKYVNAKEELWKLKYFTMQKYNLKKNPLKETKIF